MAAVMVACGAIVIGPVLDLGVGIVALAAADAFLDIGAVPDAAELGGEIERDLESAREELIKFKTFSRSETYSSRSQ